MSTLGYPFSVVAPSASSSPHTLLSSILHTALSLTTLPYRITIKYLSFLLTFLLNALSSLGIVPNGWLPAAKLQELNSIVNHMHSREDLYRRAIRELQDDIESKDSDRKKALKKLRQTKEEISQLTERLNTMQQTYFQNTSRRRGDAVSQGIEYDDYDTQGNKYPTATPNNPVQVHGTMALAALTVWWFAQSEHHSLHWKLTFSMFFPLLWSYVSWWVSSSGSNSVPVVLLALAWALIGWCLALSIGGSGAMGLSVDDFT